MSLCFLDIDICVRSLAMTIGGTIRRNQLICNKDDFVVIIWRKAWGSMSPRKELQGSIEPGELLVLCASVLGSATDPTLTVRGPVWVLGIPSSALPQVALLGPEPNCAFM